MRDLGSRIIMFETKLSEALFCPCGAPGDSRSSTKWSSSLLHVECERRWRRRRESGRQRVRLHALLIAGSYFNSFDLSEAAFLSAV